MAVQDASNITIAFKAQDTFDTPATGSGATGLEVTSAGGLAVQMAQVQSQIYSRSRMRKRPRHGSRFVPSVSYESELMVGAFDTAMEAVLGGTWASPIELDETDLTSVTISNSGATLTFGSSVIAEGVRVGMVGVFAGLSETENNGVHFPVLDISANGLVVTTDASFLSDNAQDSEFGLTFARSLSTPATYTKRYITLEEYGSDIDRSKLGSDLMFNSLIIGQQPDDPASISIGIGGRKLEYLTTGNSPNFTDPTFVSGEPLMLRDGGLYLNGVKRLTATGITAGIEAPVTGVPVIGSTLSPDTFLGMFDFTGQLTGVVVGADDFDAFDAEDRISAFLHFIEPNDPTAFVTFYFGNLSYGGYGSPAAGDGAVVHTIPLLGGRDTRGGPYAPTTVMVSTSYDPS